MFFVRMIRLVPLVAILLVVGLVIYVIAQMKYSPKAAKWIVIKVFFWITIVLTGLFLIACLYSLLDGNIPVLELFASFAAVPSAGLIITLICRAVFLKHNPQYKHKAFRTEDFESFESFWKKRITKHLTEVIMNKINKGK